MNRWTKGETANFLGWSEKQLDRKTMKNTPAGIQITLLGGQLGRHGGKGTGHHVTFDEQAVREYKAFLDDDRDTFDRDPVQVPAVETALQKLDTSAEKLDTAKNAIAKKSQKSVNIGTSKNQKSDMANFENVLLLGQKLMLTVKELAKLSGLSESFLRWIAAGHTSFKGFININGYRIARKDAEKLINDRKLLETLFDFYRQYLATKKGEK